VLVLALMLTVRRQQVGLTLIQVLRGPWKQV